jgi:hypothetical protein
MQMASDLPYTLNDNILILIFTINIAKTTGVNKMSIDKIVMAFAGVVILSSLGLSQVHHVNWLWLTAFAGLNMLQASFTGFCPLATVLKKTGAKPGVAFK